MGHRIRILIASPLGQVIAKPLESAYDDVMVEVATGQDEFVRRIAGRVRFDVVTADLIWNRPSMEWTFDGLDVIDALRHADRLAPVLLTTQGHSMERDHLEEARLRPEVSGVLAKSEGLVPLMSAIRTVALGQRLTAADHVSDRRPPLYELFVGRRGHTAARLAGAIASGNAADSASLAAAAKVSPNTANKLTSHYLGPIITQRREHDDRLPLTQATVYRWCGLHARYIVSWCRRHGHSDVLGQLPR
ncbi:response regulator [Gordonia sp. PKS22-38]|uniref:Response regulator n=1 Tax=Gordonia prachuapensis TaxID=3115651 RepID=A0ABU7MUA7_9ACTN|nr:response regulator [Gordonia sp. PKS22-38]